MDFPMKYELNMVGGPVNFPLNQSQSSFGRMAFAEVDIVSDFVSDTVSGIADGVHGMLNFAPWHRKKQPAKHLLMDMINTYCKTFFCHQTCWKID